MRDLQQQGTAVAEKRENDQDYLLHLARYPRPLMDEAKNLIKRWKALEHQKAGLLAAEQSLATETEQFADHHNGFRILPARLTNGVALHQKKLYLITPQGCVSIPIIRS